MKKNHSHHNEAAKEVVEELCGELAGLLAQAGEEFMQLFAEVLWESFKAGTVQGRDLLAKEVISHMHSQGMTATAISTSTGFSEEEVKLAIESGISVPKQRKRAANKGKVIVIEPGSSE